jgi:hypothetical protein
MPTPQEIEARVGIAPLDELQADRRALVAQVAALKGLYGPFGGFDARRKVLLAICASEAREAAREVKTTEAAITDAAHAHDAYRDWITRTELERAEYIVLEDAITAITERIHRDNALIRYVTSEPK